ncbi:glycosyltransferase [Bacillus rhizoplanae]|uniref:glycosyltransferase n=1 Tax=Bacillus rhizoplanae TaxID=2880966 RepID=UPI003D21061E
MPKAIREKVAYKILCEKGNEHKMFKNILFIVNMEEENKGGLFTATHQRIKSVSEHLDKFQVYSLRYYDGIIIRVIKKILKKKVYYKEKTEFKYDGITYKYLYIRTSLFQKMFPNISLTLFFIFYVLTHRKELKEFNLVSAHWGHPQGYFAYGIYKLLSIPYSLTLHGSDIHTIPYKNEILKRLTLKSLTNSRHNFFVSRSLWNSASKLGYRKSNYSVLYNGVNISTFSPLDECIKKEWKDKLGLRGKVVGFIGSLIEIKRADKLGSIFNYIRSEFNQEVSFLIVGDGELRGKIKKECDDYGLLVDFVGTVSPPEIPNYVNAMDILILPSRQEGFGSVIIEANSCGTLAVGSSNGGIPEAIGNSNYVVSEGEEFERRFADRVTEFLKAGYDKQALVNRIHEEFSLESIGVIEAGIYEDIIREIK